ncbi:hypothetical protein HNQ94_000482 [Salirhabdus euzebyi]|uniref:DUF1294 domain-containing protein n=1 Tax=Salirhabdus euzebyi TaxID=394506 RepID=A0A841PYJ5_9BACI|nr:DUF1294 domain-containing protein [Salirhabdus euzebyi]MBB6452061.1 hypothetical protein [Salirhabdus euzebyi]
MSEWLLSYLIAINIVGFLSMGIDKQKAKRKRWRISEGTLMLYALLGGSVGSLAGMYLFHHKTNKTKFNLGIPFLFILQLALYFFIRNLS